MKKLLSGLLIIVLLVSTVGCSEWISQTPEPTVTPTPTEVTPEPTSTPEPTPEPLYEDASGLFSVPIPTNWTAEQAEGYGILTSPDGNMTAYVIAVEAASVEEGMRIAWGIIDPTFDLEPDEVIQEPVTNGADEAVTIIYDTGDDNEIIIAGGWLYQGIAYLEIFHSDLVTFQKRVYQVTVINSGYDIYALEETDLSNTEPLPLNDELLAELEAYIVEAMERYEVPGAAVAIVKDGEIVYAKGFGVREMGGNDPVTPDTLMLIGSTTKTMTTMLMAQLVDDGMMDWDTPVVDIMPTFTVA
ncbi:MAG: serine hydrolase domain-containing protein, partial [Chloroflexota bacterium]|nr:serine hydrolase domain-containing protein [Chloroflexota bacterium]